MPAEPHLHTRVLSYIDAANREKVTASVRFCLGEPVRGGPKAALLGDSDVFGSRHTRLINAHHLTTRGQPMRRAAEAEVR